MSKNPTPEEEREWWRQRVESFWVCRHCHQVNGHADRCEVRILLKNQGGK